MGEDRGAPSDAGEGPGEVAAAAHVVLGRDLDEGEGPGGEVEEFFEERPAEAEADAVGGAGLLGW